jgi:two-component system, OmpR family, copper resistance phosphate regulon response regulator CusR
LNVLVVDDDPKYRTYMKKGLTESGLVCSLAPDGESALALLRKQRFDLVLLDVMMPGIQGWDVLEAMRAEGIDTPVIFITARDAVDERVRGLKAGGDDYIVKPFAFNELVARIHVVMRRNKKETVAKVADLEVDLLTHKATREGRPIDLTPTEFSLLRALMEKRGEPLTRTELLQSVWNIDFDPGTNVVEVQVRRLRRKIDDPFSKPLIQTVRGVGYAIRPEG